MRPRSWDVDELRQAVAESNSLSEVLRRLGLRAAGGNHKSIRGWIDRLELSTAHFDPGAARVRRPTSALEDVLVVDSSYQRAALKRRLYAAGIKSRACEMCGQGEMWRGRKLSLILDHINGVPNNNRLQNLRVVCPNCAATLDTHCGRNVPRELVECKTCGSLFERASRAQRFCCRACSRKDGTAARGVPRPTRRRVPRPPLEELIEEVRAEGFASTGRRYGVSDNAVRKWILFGEREKERATQQP